MAITIYQILISAILLLVECYFFEHRPGLVSIIVECIKYCPRSLTRGQDCQMCSTMGKRCEVLRDAGATAYAQVEDYPDPPKPLEEDIAAGRKYETLLKKMTDPKYLGDYYNSL